MTDQKVDAIRERCEKLVKQGVTGNWIADCLYLIDKLDQAEWQLLELSGIAKKIVKKECTANDLLECIARMDFKEGKNGG